MLSPLAEPAFLILLNAILDFATATLPIIAEYWQEMERLERRTADVRGCIEQAGTRATMPGPGICRTGR